MKNEICKNCTYYSAYYRQYSNIYRKSTSGFCGRNRKILAQTDSCQDFKNNEQREESREKRRLTALEHALKSINEIAQIMKEKDEDPDT